MAKGLYMRTRTAGRYVFVARYTRSLPGDSEVTRTAKQAATAAAQRFLNIKNATERLQMLLCANFDDKNACFLTFTFRDESLPANIKHTKAYFAGYMKKLRAEWRRTGRDLKYIYTVEGEAVAAFPSAAPVSGQRWEITPWKDTKRWDMLDTAPQEAPEAPTRFHVHCFLILQKSDYETVKALWPYGQVYISQMKVNEITTFQRLSNYVTKESRTGIKGNGARAYVPSCNLDKPQESSHWCNEFEGITLPHGAESIRQGAERNDIYDSFVEILVYRNPRPPQQPKPYKSKGKITPQKRK